MTKKMTNKEFEKILKTNKAFELAKQAFKLNNLILKDNSNDNKKD